MTRQAASPPRRRLGVAGRLLAAQAMVLLALGVTTWIVAAIVGPPLFQEHLQQAGVEPHSQEQFHAEEAYRYATAISIAVAISVAALTALLVTAYFSRGLQRSVAEVSAAASAVAAGRYGRRVSSLHLGQEFASLAGAFNSMAERLESVEATRRRLFGDLAHEIRTPVAVLEAYMEAVEDGVKSLDAETISMLRDQTRRLVRLSHDFAALAQAEEGGAAVAPQWVDVSELLATTLAAVGDRYAAKGVALTSDIYAGLPPLWADPQRLAQVLANLLDNALRHTPRQGRVTVTAAPRDGGLDITVRDTGEGIAAEHLPHLFERFYRADAARNRDHGGAGIGLAIAKALTQAHGGDLSAWSSGRGQGSAFTVSMPIRTSAAQRER